MACSSPRAGVDHPHRRLQPKSPPRRYRNRLSSPTATRS